MQLRRVLPSFYPVVDTAVCAARGMDPAALAAACLRGGAGLIQLRHKSGGSAAFLSLARTLAALAAAHDAWLVVNDRADIARLAGAAGVHVGQQDLPVAAVRRLLGEDAIIGLSTHSPAQVDEALGLAVTYVAVGPIFGTTTKETGYEARGLSLIEYAAGRGKPVVAIGGLTLDRVRATVAAGASAVAVIGDLFEGRDPEARTREYLAELVLAGASRD